MAKKTANRKAKRTISMTASIMFFILSLIINSAGNVLTLVTTAKIHPSFLGSAYWTAAETNLGNAFHWNLFWAFLILGVAITILNAFLVGHWDWGRAIGNVIFMVPFSALIQVFDDFFMDGSLPVIGKVSFFAGFPEAKGLDDGCLLCPLELLWSGIDRNCHLNLPTG
ncbi:GtrA-like protein domain-containing protein [Fructilactobacillus fructivorans]|nr:hypothetical protein IV51_GL000844 [Fructilactobacillus fructivorans]